MLIWNSREQGGIRSGGGFSRHERSGVWFPDARAFGSLYNFMVLKNLQKQKKKNFTSPRSEHAGAQDLDARAPTRTTLVTLSPRNL